MWLTVKCTSIPLNRPLTIRLGVNQMEIKMPTGWGRWRNLNWKFSNWNSNFGFKCLSGAQCGFVIEMQTVLLAVLYTNENGMKININFDFQHIKRALFQPTCQDSKCIYSACSHSLFIFMCVHLIIALFRVRSCFGMGPFDGLQINSLKFGCFRCNDCLMDTCTQSAGETSHPKTAWPLSLWKWVTQDVLVAKWLTLPASSVTSGLRTHSLLHQSGSQNKAVWYCKTSNP